MTNKIITICCDTGCLANKADKIALGLKEAIRTQSLKATIECDLKRTGCHGLCENGPLIRIMPEDICYYKLKESDIPEIIEETIKNGKIIERLLYKGANGEKITSQNDNPFYKNQLKIALANVGIIDPLLIEDYLNAEGYKALKKALNMKPTEIIDIIDESGLRGRGGAGFPTGRKWRQCASYEDNPKYVVCNCDEGDPGAFMDRSIFEGDPHRVLEGMAIAAYAIGANQGYIYVRNEYAMTIKHIEEAIKEAEENNYLGYNICGTGFNLHIEIIRGGGAFVCGESSALMASIEGRVGEPRSKYIRSVEKGLWQKPTVLNNVETLANIAPIILKGANWFRSVGTQNSAGTKVFTLVGKVLRTGLIEVPMGTSLKEIIFDIGGGIKEGRKFKAVQTGGPSGGCLPEELLDLPVDFDSLTSHGSMMGSGGMIVMDDRTCMIEIARYYIKFLSDESCGKCTPCREGLRWLTKILTDICEGKGKSSDIELIEMLCETLSEAALCSLGKSAANPVLTTLRYFKEEYDEHINNNYCAAGVCANLTNFEIDEDKCKGCGICYKGCPINAIVETDDKYIIDKEKCTKCGVCREVCRFEAVINNPVTNRKESRL